MSVLIDEHTRVAVQGLTGVMCELNGYMMGQEGMNIGGITALFNRILKTYKFALI